MEFASLKSFPFFFFRGNLIKATHCFKELLKIDPQIKVLLVNGYTSGATTTDATALGARGFVAKPYDIKEMLQTVRETLEHNTSQAIIE